MYLLQSQKIYFRVKKSEQDAGQSQKVPGYHPSTTIFATACHLNKTELRLKLVQFNRSSKNEVHVHKDKVKVKVSEKGNPNNPHYFTAIALRTVTVTGET